MIVGAYFFAPSLLSGVPSDKAKLSIRFVNIPAETPTDLTIQAWVDDVPVSYTGSFTEPLSTSHSLRIVATHPDGSIYAIYNRMFTVPDTTGSYALELDANIGTLTVVSL